MDYFYDFIKKEDGDIYIKCRFNKTIYEYDIGGMKISADRIFLGGQDLSKFNISIYYYNKRYCLSVFLLIIFTRK